MNLLIKLFFSFFKIGAFSFGGGYAALRLIQAEVIEKNHWINGSDFTDLVTISQMTPGPIGINAATFIGSKLAGIPGSVAATLGVITPSCIIVTIIAYFYAKYKKATCMQTVLKNLRPAVVAMILAAGLQILIPAILTNIPEKLSIANINSIRVNLMGLFLFALALILLRQKKFKKISPISVMLLCGVLELLFEICAKGA